ncbi:MAG: 3-deoxy-7-phosphoheptulonate synthase [Ignavibacteria bacterium]|nr:3-deoxy-7-phosphoheptulonate synthase [Ignavibacteria bacterium]
MIIVMNKDARHEDIENVLMLVQKLGLEFSILNNEEKTIILTQQSYDLNSDLIKALPKVEYVVTLNEDYKLVYKNINNLETKIKVGDCLIGGKEITFIAGPCSIESKEQLFKIANHLKNSGVKIIRAGAFKFRTSPYSFQGLGYKGLELLRELKEETGLYVISEILDHHDLPYFEKVVDILQIGARNMHNINLLKAVGESHLPVLLKRSYSATLKEFLFSAEYILMGGNKNVILCERGIRTFSDYTRNTLDISIVPAIKQRSHLPVIVDPSHATGKRDLVIPVSLAAIAAGADGLMVEVHHQPDLAYSDSEQAIRLEQFDELIRRSRKIAEAIGRKF